MNFNAMSRKWLLRIAAATVAATAMPASATMCGTQNYPFPFTDVAGVSDTFCRGILEAFVLGITRGTTATTFSPNDDVPRVQMTTFLQRTFDQSVKRSSRRAALEQWWTPRTPGAIQSIVVGGNTGYCAADGEHVWVTTGNQIVQVQASTGKVLGAWNGPGLARRVVVAAGKVFVVEQQQPGVLHIVDPTQAPGVTIVAASNLGGSPFGLAFDGTKLWSANAAGSVSIITLQAALPYPVTTVTAGFIDVRGALYDGANVWVTDTGGSALRKLDANGAILQSVPVGATALFPVFDGTNIWVPNQGSNSVTVVAASTGAIVTTITANASNLLQTPTFAAFDGERVLITNGSGQSVTIFKAADLSLIANIPVGASPHGACSDGINFWVTGSSGTLLRI